MSDWEDPLPFITCENGKFQLDAKTVEKLQQIKKPLVSVCIAGSYRTGKSYLMNRLIGQSTGFALGNTIESKTKGIWVWYKNHPKDKNKGLLIMDTEGLDDAMKGDETHDMKILSLSILLSGTLIYNAVGKLDNSIIDKLDFVTEISKFIQVKSNADNDYDFDTVFPHFVLVCRDKTLELKMDGKDVTADEYMERVMLTANKKAISKREKDRNEIKMKLRRYFLHRKCFFFVRPTSNDEDMLRLENINEENLNPQFTTESLKFCNYVLTHSSVKKVTTTQSMTGQILVHLSKIYVDAINDKSVPCIGSAINLVASTENSKLIQVCVSKYAEYMSGLRFPLFNDEFESAHSRSHALVVKYFADNVFLDESDEYHEQLQVELRNEYVKFAKTNYAASEKFCNSILDYLFDPIQQKIVNGSYLKNGGYEEFVKDSEQLQEKYMVVPNKGVLDKVILEKFVIKLHKDQKVILLADKMLTDIQRKIEEETLRREEAQQNLKIQQEKLKQEKIHQQTLLKDHQEQMRALELAHIEEINEANKKFNELMENRLKEQQRLMEEEFREESNRIRRQIEAMKEERRNNENKGIFRSIFGTVGSLLMLVPNPLARAVGIGMNIAHEFI